eukprot:1158975-Pelagomonas_calceolata.AAC.26
MPGVVSMMLLGGDSLGGEAPMTRWLGGLMIGLKLGKGPEVTGLNMDCWGLRMFSTCVLLKGTSCEKGMVVLGNAFEEHPRARRKWAARLLTAHSRSMLKQAV